MSRGKQWPAMFYFEDGKSKVFNSADELPTEVPVYQSLRQLAAGEPFNEPKAKKETKSNKTSGKGGKTAEKNEGGNQSPPPPPPPATPPAGENTLPEIDLANANNGDMKKYIVDNGLEMPDEPTKDNLVATITKALSNDDDGN